MRRGLLAVAALLSAALLVAVVVATPRGDPSLDRAPSAGSTGNPGMAAAARWLAATGRTVHRLEAGGDRPVAGATWLLLAPAAPLDEAEVSALVEHAAAGGLVVWAFGEGPEQRQPALSRRFAAHRLPAGGERSVAALDPHPLFTGLSLRAGASGVTSAATGARAVLGDAERPAAVALPVGRGEILLLAGPELLDNRHIAEDGALSLWVRLAARGPVAFDERFLRPLAAGHAIAPPPLAWLGLQLAFLVALLAAARWPRLGAVRPPPPEVTGRTTRDYLASLAELYRLAGAEPELAATSWGRLRRRLQREAGLPAGLSGEAAARWLERGAAAAAGPLRRGEAALARGGAGLLLEVTRAAADLEAARRRGGR